MSLCNVCPDPGRCCRRFSLGTILSDPSDGPDGARRALTQRAGEVLPFEPLEPNWPEEPLTPWFWTCPKVTAEGRCSIYETRPHSPCRVYEPAEDGLCVFWHLQQQMDAALAKAPDIFADDAFDGLGEWTPPASGPCKDAAD